MAKQVTLDHKTWLGIPRSNTMSLSGGAAAALVIAILTAIETKFPWPVSLVPYVPFISAVIDAVIAFVGVTGVPSFSSRDPATPPAAVAPAEVPPHG